MNIKGTVVAGVLTGGVALLGAAAAHADIEASELYGMANPAATALPEAVPAKDLHGLASLADAFAGTVSDYKFVTIDGLLHSDSIDAGLVKVDEGIASVLPGVEYFLKDLSLGQWAGQVNVPDSVDLAGAGLPEGGYIGSFGDNVLHLLGMGDGPAPSTDNFDPSLALQAFVVDSADLLDPFHVLAGAVGGV